MTDVYTDLAKRGEVLVSRIRRQESTKATARSAGTTTRQGEDDQDPGRQDHEVDRAEDEHRRQVDRQEGDDDREEVLGAQQREGHHHGCQEDRVERDHGAAADAAQKVGD